MSTFVHKLPHATTARAIAERLPSSTVEGDPARPIRGIAALSSAEADVLTFCDAADASDRLRATRASVVIVRANASTTLRSDQTAIAVDDVRAAFIDTVAFLVPNVARPMDPATGIDASAQIDATASIAASAWIGGAVTIGPRTRVGPGAVIYADCKIGSDCVIGPGAVIGWVGLSYHDRGDGQRLFFPHLAGVRIGDGVDIGAQACVCRGMLSHTEIGDGVKIGSLVYVSHGVVIERRAWLSAGTMVAGHAAIGERVVLGIGATVIDNVKLAADVLVGGGSVVTKDAPAGSKLCGVPAHPVPAMRRFGPTPRD
jgi:UDP-3-O-[3-hydroxymyristoyl] glucosamine N-acyltransferase